MARHLLVTNDYPPKTGGIQVYLHELWRRLETDRAVVLTASSHPDAAAFDARIRDRRGARGGQDAVPADPSRAARHRVGDRAPPTRPGPPRPGVAARAARPASFGSLRRVVHGAEATMPSRIPIVASSLRFVLQARRRRDLRRGRTPKPSCATTPPIRAADHPGAAGRRHDAVHAPRATVARGEVRASLGVEDERLRRQFLFAARASKGNGHADSCRRATPGRTAATSSR